MDELLKPLMEQRDAAAKALKDFASPIIAEKRDFTADEDVKYSELRKSVKRYDKRITEMREQAKADEALAEARKSLGSSPAVVKNEPRTYGEGSENSYVADLVRASAPIWNDHDGAIQRLARHSHELAVDAASNPEERKRVARQLRDGTARTENGQLARRSITNLLESRAMDTTSASGGSFVTPVYFVQDYAPYRQLGRVFVDAANRQPLPEYGMTVFLPQVQSAAGVAAQTQQGQGVLETDPTAGYLSANLNTEAGQVTISQQLLDRAGPNFQFDKMVFDQLQRAYNFNFNGAVLTAALATAGTITDNNAASAQRAFADIGQAKSVMTSTAGTILAPTHVFMTQTQWSWIETRTTSAGNPVVLPDYAGVFQAIAGGNASGTPVIEGNTGYKMVGLPVYEDGTIPNSSSNTQVVVAHMPEVWLWEGDLVPRVIPQTYAQNLEVLLQLYAYYAVIVRYPVAVQKITGTAFPASPTF